MRGKMPKPGSSDVIQNKFIAYALVHMCQYIMLVHGRDYVLFTELQRCVDDVMRQIELDKENEKMMKENGSGIEPETYRKRYNYFGTDTHHKHTRTRCGNEMQRRVAGLD